MRYPEPDKTTTGQFISLSSRKPDNSALRVPVTMYTRSMAAVEVPELTPDGAEAPTLIFSRSMTEAEALKAKAIKHAEHVGLPTVSASTKQAQKAARSRWSATGQHL